MIIGDAFTEALIDVMADDLEMDTEDITIELEACGFDPEEAEHLASRPWARLPSLLKRNTTHLTGDNHGSTRP